MIPLLIVSSCFSIIFPPLSSPGHISFSPLICSRLNKLKSLKTNQSTTPPSSSYLYFYQFLFSCNFFPLFLKFSLPSTSYYRLFFLLLSNYLLSLIFFSLIIFLLLSNFFSLIIIFFITKFIFPPTIKLLYAHSFFLLKKRFFFPTEFLN
jgi:hypothetical protein